MFRISILIALAPLVLQAKSPEARNARSTLIFESDQVLVFAQDCRSSAFDLVFKNADAQLTPDDPAWRSLFEKILYPAMRQYCPNTPKGLPIRINHYIAGIHLEPITYDESLTRLARETPLNYMAATPNGSSFQYSVAAPYKNLAELRAHRARVAPMRTKVGRAELQVKADEAAGRPGGADGDRTVIADPSLRWWFDASAFEFDKTWGAIYLGDVNNVGNFIHFQLLFKVFALMQIEKCPETVQARQTIRIHAAPTSGTLTTYRIGGLTGSVYNAGEPGRDLPPFQIDARFGDAFAKFTREVVLLVGPRPQYDNSHFVEYFKDADLLFSRNSCNSPVLKLIAENFLRAATGRPGIEPPETWSTATVARLDQAMSGTLSRQLEPDELNSSTTFRAGGRVLRFEDVKAAYDQLNARLKQANPNLVGRSPLVFRDDAGVRYVAGADIGTDTIRVFRVSWQEIEAAWRDAEAKKLTYNERRAFAEQLEKRYGAYLFLTKQYAGFAGRLPRDASNAALLSELLSGAVP